MSVHDMDSSAQLFAAAMDVFARFGISITIGTDFEEYRRLLEVHRPEQPLGPPFDPRIHNLHESNAFWIVGRDATGKVVSSQAMKVLKTDDLTLSEYMRTHFVQFPPVGFNLDMEASRFRPGPSARRLKGKMVYHGEVWLDDRVHDYRGSGIVGVLSRFALMTCQQRFDPDIIFGFMARRNAFRGLSERFGYMHVEPGALFWQLADSDVAFEAFLTWMTGEDLKFLMSIPVQDLITEPQAKPQAKPLAVPASNTKKTKHREAAVA